MSWFRIARGLKGGGFNGTTIDSAASAINFKPEQVLQEDLGLRSPRLEERLRRTLQDRFVSEVRFAAATTADQADAVLEAVQADHNRRFAIPPRADAIPAWRTVRRGTESLSS